METREQKSSVVFPWRRIPDFNNCWMINYLTDYPLSSWLFNCALSLLSDWSFQIICISLQYYFLVLLLTIAPSYPGCSIIDSPDTAGNQRHVRLKLPVATVNKPLRNIGWFMCLGFTRFSIISFQCQKPFDDFPSGRWNFYLFLWNW